MEKINFTPKQILKKEFKEKMRGYDPAEVDAFLDNVIQDYESFGREIDQLEQENAQLSQRAAGQPVQQAPVQPSAAPVQTTPVPKPAAPSDNVTNAQILQRLEELERKVNG